ncbi:MAG: ferrous iron transport protein A [Ruminococcaceae bacterium]|nr:ferrous iron transport protein A [Oscillospiraceae bacterium]
MKERLERLPVGGGGVIVKMKRSPRMERIGLRSGATVVCTYKSRGVVVLALGNRLIALRRKELGNIWVDY